MDEPTEPPRQRRADPVTAIMLVVTAIALFSAIWLKAKGTPVNEPPRVGAMAPSLRLLDVETSEPLVLVGQRGKVVWVVFWSAASPSASSSLAAIERASVRLRARRRFAMVAAAVDIDQPARVRAAVAESRVELPVYLASAESLRSVWRGPRISSSARSHRCGRADRRHRTRNGPPNDRTDRRTGRADD